MRAQLLHLSGPYRGKTMTYGRRHLRIGTAPDATLRFPQRAHVAKNHAEITFAEAECSFHLTALEGRVFVNGWEVREVILEHNDLLEIGLNGPKLRFHIPPGSTCKPVRQMLRDAHQVRRESGLLAFAHALQRDLLFQSSWQARLVMGVLVVAVAFGAAYMGGTVGTQHTTKRQESFRQQQANSWTVQMTALREQLQKQLEEFRHEQAGHASREELAELRSDLARRAQVVDTLVAGDQALQRVLDVYTRGVCLIHGAFALQRPPDEQNAASQESQEPLFQLEYFGSGFLATSEGHVITNRHVAEPWSNDETAAQLLAQGLTPHFVELTASFPGREPVPVDPTTIRLSGEGVDLAVMQIHVEGVPVLPLYEGDVRAFRGGHVILLGYPTGLNGVLARAEPDLVADVLAHATDTRTLIIELAARGAIAPVITQGALNEVRERRLVYDAETTFGGSGGPVFGPDGTVIGVNFAITRGFGGSNFGVPIEFARRLLP
jgi:S1-C subfamily serine protease